MKLFETFIFTFILLLTLATLFETVKGGEKELKSQETQPPTTDSHVFIESALRKILEQVQKNDDSAIPEETLKLVGETCKYCSGLSEKYKERLVLSHTLIALIGKLTSVTNKTTRKELYGLVLNYFSGEAKRDTAFHLNVILRMVTTKDRLKDPILSGIKKEGIEKWTPERVRDSLGIQFTELCGSFPDLKTYYPKIWEQIGLIQNVDGPTRRKALEDLMESISSALSNALANISNKLYQAYQTDRDCKLTSVDIIKDWFQVAILITGCSGPYNMKILRSPNPLQTQGRENNVFNQLYERYGAYAFSKIKGDLEEISKKTHFRSRMDLRILLLQKILKETQGSFSTERRGSIKDLVNDILDDFKATQTQFKGGLILTYHETAFLRNLQTLANAWNISYENYITDLNGYIQRYLKDQKSVKLSSDPTFVSKACIIYWRVVDLLIKSEDPNAAKSFTKARVIGMLGPKTYTELREYPFRTDDVFKNCGLEKPHELDNEATFETIIKLLNSIAESTEAALRVALSSYKTDLQTFSQSTSRDINQIQDVLQCLKIILQHFKKLPSLSSNINQLLGLEGTLKPEDAPEQLKPVIGALDPETIIVSFKVE